MLKRAFITIIAFIALLIFSGAFLLSSRQLPSIVNRFLPQDWQLEFPQGGLANHAFTYHTPRIFPTLSTVYAD